MGGFDALKDYVNTGKAPSDVSGASYTDKYGNPIWSHDQISKSPGLGGLGGMIMAGLSMLSPGAGMIYDADMQKRIADQNLRFQQENQNYMRGIQQTMFQREDNSVQRRMQDLVKAGMNPVLAAGQGAGAGQVVSTQAPQNEFKPNYGQILANALNVKNLKEQLISMKKNQALTDAQIQATNAQTNKTKSETNENTWNLAFAQHRLMPTNQSLPTAEKVARYGTDLLMNSVKQWKDFFEKVTTKTKDKAKDVVEKIKPAEDKKNKIKKIGRWLITPPKDFKG